MVQNFGSFPPEIHNKPKLHHGIIFKRQTETEKKRFSFIYLIFYSLKIFFFLKFSFL